MKKILSFLLAGLLLICVFTAPAAEAKGLPGTGARGSSYDFAEVDGSLFAISGDGSVYLAAEGEYSQQMMIESILGWDNIDAISGNYYVAAGLRRDGTVVSNREEQRQELAGWQGVTQIVTAYDHVIGLRQDGTVLSVGSDWMSEPGMDWACLDGHYDFSSWTQVRKLVSGGCAAGWSVIGLRRDGTLLDTGDSYMGESYPEYDWSGPAEHVTDVVSSGWLHVALREDGTVICKGTDAPMRREYLAGWRNIVQVAIVGESTVIGLQRDGTVRVAREDLELRPEEGWHDITAIWASEEYLVGLRKDGTAVAWCSQYYEYMQEPDQSFRQIEAWSNLESIFVQGRSVVGLRRDGGLYSINFDPAILPRETE